MTRARRPLHEHMASPATADESEHTRDVVAGELAAWVQVCTEIAAQRHRELVAADDPDSAEAAARVAHEIAGQIRTRSQQWANES